MTFVSTFFRTRQPPETRTITRRKRRKGGNITALKRRIWNSIERLTTVIDDAEIDDGTLVSAAHALSQTASVYARILQSEKANAEPQASEPQEIHIQVHGTASKLLDGVDLEALQLKF
jgi:hypothetical protein